MMDIFGPSGYENFIVLDCQCVHGFEAECEDLIEQLQGLTFGVLATQLSPREFAVVIVSSSAADRDKLRPSAPRGKGGATMGRNGVVRFFNETKIEVWRGFNERTRLLMARVLCPFIRQFEPRITTDHGDDVSTHYNRYPWELFLGR